MPGLILSRKMGEETRDTSILKVAGNGVIFWSRGVFVYKGGVGTLTGTGEGEGKGEEVEAAKTTAKGTTPLSRSPGEPGKEKEGMRQDSIGLNLPARGRGSQCFLCGGILILLGEEDNFHSVGGKVTDASDP